MAKTRKHILSKETVGTIDRFLENRDTQKKRITDDVQQNARLLAPDGLADVTQPEAQAGRRLHRSEVMKRLQRLNPNLKYARSKAAPDRGGIYIHRPPYLLDWSVDCPGYFLCGIPHEMVREFDLRQTREDRVSEIGKLDWTPIQRVDGRERGWRSILLTLLEAGLLSPSGIDREFQLTKGRASRTWHEAVN